MIILGLDIAIRCGGYGVIEMKSLNDMSILDCGVIKNKQKMPHSECLRRLAGGVRELVSTYNPHAASIEDAFYKDNVKTAMILSLARGAAITVLAEAGVPSFGYAPKVAKRAVVGSGMASKDQVATMVATMLNIHVADIPRDATDALAMAVCHGQLALRPELEHLVPKPI